MTKQRGIILWLMAMLCIVGLPGVMPSFAVPSEQSVEDAATVNFMFDAVEIPTFVKIIGELTGRRFVVDSGIDGKITVVSPKVSRKDVYPLFLSILESAGCSVVDDGGVQRVVKLESQPLHLAHVVGPDEATPLHGIITKIFRLKHVSAEEVRKVLDTRVGRNGVSNVKSIADTNYLIVTDTAANIKRVEQLVAKIDLPGTSRVTEVVPLKYASAEDLAVQINMAIAENTSRAEQLRQRISVGNRSSGYAPGGRRMAVVVASPHSNSLIVVGSASQVKSLRELIAKMDVDVPSGRGRLNAIFLNYLVAEDAAKNISALLAHKNSGVKGSKFARDIAIEASPASNALLVDARPGDFEVVRQLVEQLDKQPAQVHINVLIMEVNDSDGFNFGIDLAAIDKPSAVGDSVVQGSYKLQDNANGLLNSIQTGLFPRGISIGVAHGTSRAADGTIQVGYPALLNIEAIKSNHKFKVLSESSLQAQNNKPADMSVVNEIPILTSKISGGSGTARDIIQNIDRVDVGVKLTLTPHIIPGDSISMELNPSIEAVIDKGPPGTEYTPTIARRQVHTTVSVKDGRTIVIAGLTRRDTRDVEHRVPLLGSIPVLGWLFRHVEKEDIRTDILIFVTPTIVSNPEDAENMRSYWEKKTGLKKDAAKPEKSEH